jgi:hypothetical protein
MLVNDAAIVPVWSESGFALVSTGLASGPRTSAPASCSASSGSDEILLGQLWIR